MAHIVNDWIAVINYNVHSKETTDAGINIRNCNGRVVQLESSDNGDYWILWYKYYKPGMNEGEVVVYQKQSNTNN